MLEPVDSGVIYHERMRNRFHTAALVLVPVLGANAAACSIPRAPGMSQTDVASISTENTGPYDVVEKRVENGTRYLRVEADQPQRYELIEAVGLRPVDRTLGAAFGVVRGVVILLALAVVVNMTPLRTAPWWTEAAGAEVSTAALRGLKPVLPGEFGQYLP